MENKKEDLRIRRTHKLLTEALFTLLETTSFDDISVVDICEQAMVHRATFYKHFKDKYAFMEYATKEKIREFYTVSVKQQDYSDIHDIYRSIISNALNFVEENKQMFKISASSAGSTFLEYIHKTISAELLAFLKATHQEEDIAVPLEMVADFLTGGFTALVRWWLTNDTSYSKEDMEQYIEKMFSNSHIDDN